jgi:hypothetical protein
LINPVIVTWNTVDMALVNNLVDSVPKGLQEPIRKQRNRIQSDLPNLDGTNRNDILASHEEQFNIHQNIGALVALFFE